MIILEDTRQQAEKHKHKHIWFEKNGIEVRRCRLYVGDYALPNKQDICIDTKKDIQELIGDICGKHHVTFRNELIRAQEANIRLIILVENEGAYIGRKKDIYTPTITRLEDLHKWVNPRLFMVKNGVRLYPNATRGITLMKACMTMQKKYGCTFMFCKPSESAKTIIDILGKE